MENNKELLEKKSAFDDLKENINGTEDGIEREFAKGFNSWADCFGSRVFQIEAYLSIKAIQEELGQDKYKEIIKKLENLKIQLRKLKDDYSDVKIIPSREIREEFVKKVKEIL